MKSLIDTVRQLVTENISATSVIMLALLVVGYALYILSKVMDAGGD